MKEEEENQQRKLSEIAKREEETLAQWQSARIFEKSLEQTKDREEFVFYDGPPFATGFPHYGHILASVIKDSVTRYQTMRGRHVRRVWGWDCHGLPVENLIEQELNLGHKKDIEEYGIGKFNEAAFASVLRYDVEWKKIIPRIGRFIDMEHAYRTMDANYTESIWWAFKTLFDKGLVYQGFKSMHICPRCETTLSSNEVAEGYKDITDISVTVKFELVKEPGTYILAWTTTPWTLPGNVALAVAPSEEYVKVASGDEYYILATARIEKVFTGKEYTIVERMKGEDLAGVAYKPVFDYYASQSTLNNQENGWKIYDADFVTMESGTGVVHIAPAFGEDDMTLGKKENLPFIQHVGMDGMMKKEVRDFAGVSVKPKGDHQATDILIIKYLAGAKALFAKEKIVHAYPHCWRCDTPLLNYAAESWFVKVSAFKDRLLSENAKTSWVPKNMRDGRFGQWLLGARDWAISRSRFWGAPLPVWQCSACDERAVFGSRGELSARTKKSGNRYLVMRHGEAESNARGIVSSKIDGISAYGLTEGGRKEVEASGEKLKGSNIDLIITSPFVRTKETAEVVAGTIGFDTRKIIVDDRLKEIDTGIFDGRPIGEYRDNFASIEEKFTKRPDGGENLLDMKRRTMALLAELETQYSGKTILLVTHEYAVWMLSAGARGATIPEAVALRWTKEDFVETGTVLDVPYAPFPHNADFEFDFHRPYIDEVEVSCQCGEKMKRVQYVFDCWFESGSMPYAQFHYPFENKELFEKNFPADFIAEGVDQTRGWFYNMLVLSVGLFGREPFRNVIVNGLVLVEDGQKMSKSRRNYPDSWDMLNKYGADAIRYYLLSSPIVHAEDLAFSERGVDEVVKKFIMRLGNVLSFYELYSENENEPTVAPRGKPNVLDQWILSRLKEVMCEVTESLDTYEIDRAVKPLNLFVDDLSTWYLRRSRDRFKDADIRGMNADSRRKDREAAIATTHTVLLEFSKLLAPVMPFLADHIYHRVGGEKESVHLEAWPTVTEFDKQILAKMNMTRQIVADALSERAKAGLKVRQPLSALSIGGQFEFFEELVIDEVNVKKIVHEGDIAGIIKLDTNITPELKQEGQFRDLLRTIQELRKDTGLTPSDVVMLRMHTNADGRSLVEKFESELKKTALIRGIIFEEVAGETVVIDGVSFVCVLESV
ncbi:MAG: class I tRNA ligase family protein [Candidatus Yonathbacteria bacterium]|nr:class I tRNA ligase family protein [Candidatus Yonathbacteria bacterium]